MHPRTSSRPRPCLRRLPLALATASLLCAALPIGAGPLPGGLQVIRGQASVVTHGQQMTVTNSAGAILNWQQFSIGQGQSVYFQQPSSLSSVLNRVTGRDPSNILGSLGSNGRVWLLNPQGVLFGRDARIDVAGLVASTLNISDGDWAAGRYRLFQDGPGAALLNQGELRSAAGGRILLIGGSAGVRNEGLVEAPGGQVMLAAGQSVELVDTALPNLAVRIDAPAGEALNLGRLVAGSGQVDLMAAIVNQSGIVRADALGDGPAGRVVLDASERLTLGSGSETTAVGAATAGGGLVLQGRHIALLDGSLLDVSGATGGGSVRVGGGERGQDLSLRNAEALWMGAGARIVADATAQGSGGSIVLWSDHATRAFGSFSARGGARGGDGGFIETSGGWLDARPRSVRTDAPRGRAGRWLLDPWDITIVDGGSDSNIGGDPDFQATGQGAILSTDTIVAALNAGNHVTITTSSTGFEAGDIRMLNATIDATPPTPVSLTLEADRNIVLDFATIRSRSEALSLTLTAANSGEGSILINASTIETRGGGISLGGNGELCNFRFCDGEFGRAALATNGTGLNNGVAITSSLLDAGDGAIAVFGQSEVTNAETAGILVADGSTLRGRDIVLRGVVVSDGSLQRTGVKIAGGLIAATNSVVINGQAYSSVYSYDGSLVGVDILGEVRVDGTGGANEGDSLLSVYGYSEESGYGGYGGYGGFDGPGAPRYGVGIRGGTGKLIGTGGIRVEIQGEVTGLDTDFGILAEGTGTAYIDASQAAELSLLSSGAIKLSGDIRVPDNGGTVSLDAGFSEIRIVGASISGDPSRVTMDASLIVLGTELEPARLVFGDNTALDIAGTFFLLGTDVLPLAGRILADEVRLQPDAVSRMRPLDVLFDLPAATSLLAAGGPITIRADGIGIGAGATIHSPHTGAAIVLAGSGENGDNIFAFDNQGGANALSAPNGWWEVWAAAPEDEGLFNPNGLVPAFRQYGANFAVGVSPAVSDSNAFYFEGTADLVLQVPPLNGAVTKVYDGNTSLDPAYGLSYSGTRGQDVVVGAPGFSNKNVGTEKEIVLQPGFSATGIAGPDGAPVYGYSVDDSAGSGIGAITAATLNLIGAVVNDRAYDGTSVASVAQWNFSGFVAGDDLGAEGNASFADRNVGTAKPVTLVVTGKSGVDAGNYVFGTALTGTTTASITPALLNLAAGVVADKVYDGGTSAAVSSFSVAGVVGSESVSFTTSGAFDDKNAGVGKAATVTLTGFGGTDAGNYALGGTLSVAASATITAATVDLLAASAANKVYDGNTTATVTGFTLAGTIAGDDVTPAGSGAFGNRNAGTNKPVSVTLSGLTGTDAANYQLGATTATTLADITPAPLDLVGASVADKVYDGNTTATATGWALAGIVGSDAVTGGGTASFADKNVGSAKPVALTLTGLSGTDAGNYMLGGTTTGSTTAAITPATVDLLGGTAAGKVYDGNSTATVTGWTLAGVVSGDGVTATGSGAFADRNVGAAKPVALTLAGLAGTDAGNYVLGTTAAATTASITPATLNLAGGTAANKTYDRTTTATVNSLALVGVVAGDAVTGTGTGAFADPNAGTGKTVALTLSGLAGADAGNYQLGTTSGSTTAAILPAPVNLAAGSAAGKTYDGTVNTTATALTLAGVIGGDTVTGSGDARFADRDAGSNKPVTLTLLGLGGADAGNYTLGSTLTATTTATIAPALLTYVATPATMGSADPLPGFTGVVTGLVGGDTLAGATTGTAVFNAVLEGTPQPGSYAINGSGLAATNYSFTQAAGNATALTVLTGSAPPPPPPISGEEAAGVVSPVERIAGVKPPRDLLPQPFVTMPEIGRLLDLMQGLEPGRTDLFGALDVNGLGPDRMAAVLAARDEYKKTLFAQALGRLEQDPSIADAPGCATAQQAASGQCLMVTPLDRESVISNARVIERLPVTAPQPPVPTPAPPAPAPQAGTPPAAPAAAPVAPPAALAARPPVPVVVPAFPDRRPVRQAVLPQIQRKIAVVIGVDEYADPRIPRLANSVRDAQAVARSLGTTLGYETVVLENPTKAAMFRVFNRLAAETGPNDSVVLYYAGHGDLVEKTGLGYWQLSDADVMRPETWVSNSDINRVLRGIGASQVALVSDSCFAGSLIGETRIRGVNPNQDPAQLLARRAAVVMASGSNEPVADSGKNGHSPFAFSLMQAIERVPSWRPGSNIFEQVRFQVARQLPQRPQYGASTVGGHEPGADYLFEQRQIEGVTR